MQVAGRRVLHACTRADDEVDRGQLVLRQPEGFLDDATHAIACHGIARGTDRHREPQAGRAKVIRPEGHAEVTVRNALSSALDFFEVRLQAQTPLRRKGVPDQGMSFLRPFARRRAMTFWPFFVAMRARKPCVRLRRTLLG